MCFPLAIPLLMLAVSAAGAVAQKQASDRAVIQQAETNNNNTREGYRVAQEQTRAADAQAFEQQTDRARKASQELSMARVISAQGGGSLASRAINITAGAADDFSRIDTSLSNLHSSGQDKLAALQTGNLDALAASQNSLAANQTRMGAQIGAAAASAAGTAYSNDLGINQAKYFTKPVIPDNFGGNLGIGDR
jgi:hypothetical protein